jgi:hypothetical protein
MDDKKRDALEAAGWEFCDAEDLLELTEEERKLVEERLDAKAADEASKDVEENRTVRWEDLRPHLGL